MEQMKEIVEQLEQGVRELFESERYKQYLKVMSKFHHYSFRNTLLIAMQRPDATLVAGYTTWKHEFGRQVQRGEKGIKIIAPSPFKAKRLVEQVDEKTNKPMIGSDGEVLKKEIEITIPSFRVTTVFDVTQTQGRELPSIGVGELTAEVKQYNILFKAVEQVSPVPVEFEAIDGSAHGYYSLTDKRIVIDKGMGELQNLKTLIHEIAHAILHDTDLRLEEQKIERPDRHTREVQAESVAYAVCQYYGLDTSEYSFAYISSWSSGRELVELQSSMELIRNTASELIGKIDANIREIQNQKEFTSENQKSAEHRKSVLSKLASNKASLESKKENMSPEKSVKKVEREESTK